MKSIVIGNDNAAIDLKKTLIKILEDYQIPYVDMGVNSSDDDTYYPLIAQQVCKAIIDSGYKKEGILICGTGIGMAMTAGKFPGIFAAVCHDNFSVERARLSNNANVLCMGARVIGPELAKKILKEWLETEYKEGTSSQPKVEAMRKIDDTIRCEQ